MIHPVERAVDLGVGRAGRLARNLGITLGADAVDDVTRRHKQAAAVAPGGGEMVAHGSPGSFDDHQQVLTEHQWSSGHPLHGVKIGTEPVMIAGWDAMRSRLRLDVWSSSRCWCSV